MGLNLKYFPFSISQLVAFVYIILCTVYIHIIYTQYTVCGVQCTVYTRILLYCCNIYFPFCDGSVIDRISKEML